MNIYPKKDLVFQFKFHWIYFKRAQFSIRQHCFSLWHGTHQLTIHYLIHAWYPSVNHPLPDPCMVPISLPSITWSMHDTHQLTIHYLIHAWYPSVNHPLPDPCMVPISLPSITWSIHGTHRFTLHYLIHAWYPLVYHPLPDPCMIPIS